MTTSRSPRVSRLAGDTRIIGILYGVTTSDLATSDGIPAFLQGIQLRDINELDEYFRELKRRVDND